MMPPLCIISEIPLAGTVKMNVKEGSSAPEKR